MLLTDQQKKEAYCAECEMLDVIPTDKGYERFLERFQPYDVEKMISYGGVKFMKDGEWRIGFPGFFTGFVEYNMTLGCMDMLGCTSEDRAVIRSWRL
jgi:hypothetical protein